MQLVDAILGVGKKLDSASTSLYAYDSSFSKRARLIKDLVDRVNTILAQSKAVGEAPSTYYGHAFVAESGAFNRNTPPGQTAMVAFLSRIFCSYFFSLSFSLIMCSDGT